MGIFSYIIGVILSLLLIAALLGIAYIWVTELSPLADKGLFEKD